MLGNELLVKFVIRSGSSRSRSVLSSNNIVRYWGKFLMSLEDGCSGVDLLLRERERERESVCVCVCVPKLLNNIYMVFELFIFHSD